MFDGRYLVWNRNRIKCIIDFYGHKFLYGKKLLDIGCGQADISGALYRLGADVTAVDGRQEHLQIASKKFSGIKVIKADLDQNWCFKGQKFDIILDLAFLCHLRNYEQHLIDVCNSTTHLVLETAVCDSDDPNKCIMLEESKAIYDNSINGIACRPTAATIERILTKCNMNFKRMDSSKLNSVPFVYDWQLQNNLDTNINKRRLWFAVKNDTSTELTYVSPPAYQLIGGNASGGNILPNMNLQISPNPTANRPLSSSMPKPPLEVSPQPTKITTKSTEITYMPVNNIDPSDTDRVRINSKRFAILPGTILPQYPNLKVLYLPLREQNATIDAWNNLGVQLRIYDFLTIWENNGHNNNMVNQQFLEHVKNFQPQLIQMQLQITNIITPETVKQAKSLSPGVIITNWSGDIRKNVIHEMNVMSRVIDYTLLSNTGQLDLYKRAGCKNVNYWQIGYNPKVHYPKKYTNFDYDVTFTGNNYKTNFPDGPLREQAVLKCTQFFLHRFGIFGTGWANKCRTCDHKEVNEIYNKSVCALSISNFNSVGHYFSDRLLHCLASGRPTIAWYFPGCESYFKEGKEIFYARNTQDIVNIVNMCKQDPAKANEVGMNGHQRVLEEHTYTSRILELIDMVGLSHKEGK